MVGGLRPCWGASSPSGSAAQPRPMPSGRLEATFRIGAFDGAVVDCCSLVPGYRSAWRPRGPAPCGRRAPSRRGIAVRHAIAESSVPPVALRSEPPRDRGARIRGIRAERARSDGGVQVRAQPLAVLADAGQRRSDRPRDADTGALGRGRRDAVAAPESQGRGQFMGQRVQFLRSRAARSGSFHASACASSSWRSRRRSR